MTGSLIDALPSFTGTRERKKALRVGADGIGVDATERHTSKRCQASGADQSSVDSKNITWYTKASLRDHSANLQSIKQESI